MQRCDAYVALLWSCGSGAPVRSDLTHVEPGWASRVGKPILLVCDEMHQAGYPLL
jgi:hypothetical protein